MKKTFIIAEIGQAHEGSLGIAHSYIDALANTGVDAVKFQTHIAEAESSIYEPFRVNFSYEDKTRFDYWKRMEFSLEQWIGLKEHCEKKNMEFISSPFSNAAVDLLEEVGIKRYKVGSGEANNFLLLEKIARTKKPIIISSGMSSYKEIDEILDFLKPFGNKNISLLQCTTAYPTKPGEWGLELIPKLKKKYKKTIGFSDHSGVVHSVIAAVTLGAEIIEFHVVFDKEIFGPDSKASITIKETHNLVKAIRDIEKDKMSKHSKEINEDILIFKSIFEKSLAVNKAMKKGDIIRFEDLEAKKPKGYGIDAKNYTSVIGKRLNIDLSSYAFIKIEDIL